MSSANLFASVLFLICCLGTMIGIVRLKFPDPQSKLTRIEQLTLWTYGSDLTAIILYGLMSYVWSDVTDLSMFDDRLRWQIIGLLIIQAGVVLLDVEGIAILRFFRKLRWPPALRW